MSLVAVARSELILGGQKSGKSRRGESLARAWLDQSSNHRAVLIATAQPGDEEMRLRIARHQCDRAERVPGIITVEEPYALAAALTRHSDVQTLVLVDCLTLWLTNLVLPFALEPAIPESNAPTTDTRASDHHIGLLVDAMVLSPGPLVLVGNEIGLGVIPMGAEVRAFVDQLGVLNQAVARACARVTLMAAGLPLTLKDL